MFEKVQEGEKNPWLCLDNLEPAAIFYLHLNTYRSLQGNHTAL